MADSNRNVVSAATQNPEIFTTERSHESHSNPKQFYEYASALCSRACANGVLVRSEFLYNSYLNHEYFQNQYVNFLYFWKIHVNTTENYIFDC